MSVPLSEVVLHLRSSEQCFMKVCHVWCVCYKVKVQLGIKRITKQKAGIKSLPNSTDRKLCREAWFQVHVGTITLHALIYVRISETKEIQSADVVNMAYQVLLSEVIKCL